MSVPILSFSEKQLVRLGLHSSENIHYQTSPEELTEQTLNRGEGKLSEAGALAIHTGEFTGRSPKDRFIVKDETSAHVVDWNGFNIPIEEKYFHSVHKKIMTYLNELPEVWIRDSFACADERYRLSIRLVAEKPWTSLFAYNMFLRPTEAELDDFKPQWHIFAAPGLKLNAAEDGVRQSNAVIVSLKHKTVLIAGTGYTGEVKKSIFSVLNFILPHQQNVLSMHCSANKDAEGRTAIFFGLSGTGKTTLSTDPDRLLIGDDEHGWTEDSIFNFEGGCYAKTINLTEENEPQIFNAIRPGALLENVMFKPDTNVVDFENSAITENTRVSYPLHFIANAAMPATGNVPEHIFFLTCDAFGVLPPISLLNPQQAMYQFISGYTAKIAGTEEGITEPKPTFSACFGAPFLPLHPGVYAKMLGNKLTQSNAKVWLVNTGWTGGTYGEGSRIKIKYTRALINAALSGSLNDVDTYTDEIFGFEVPKECPGLPSEILNPRNTWADKNAYDEKAKYVANLFIKNFGKYKDGVDAEILNAAPNIK